MSVGGGGGASGGVTKGHAEPLQDTPGNPEPLVTCTDNEDIQFDGDVRLYILQHINL